MARNKCLRGGLNEIAQTTRDFRLKLDGLTGLRGTKNFNRPDRRQLQSAHCGNGLIALSDDARQLGRRFDEQDAGKDWLIREMTEQKRFIAAHPVFGLAGAAGLQTDQTVQEPELRAVREGIQGGGQFGIG